MKTNKTLIKELKKELHYWQSRARIEARGLQATREKCQDIGVRMRALQNEIARRKLAS